MYGIDFGTSNTVVTVREKGLTRVLDLGEGGVIPSLMYFERGKRPSIGREAMEDYSAALQRWRDTGNLYARFRFFQALKLALKDEHFEGTRLFGERIRVEALVAIFLREVKRRADEATGGGSGRLVLGRPVVLSRDPAVDRMLQDRFREAALLAGFEEVDFVYEPVAASVNCRDLGQGGSETILVFDFGGGTLDISLARSRARADLEEAEDRARDGASSRDRGIEPLASVGRDLGGYLLNEDISRARIIRHFGAGGKFRTMTGRELEMPIWITNQVASFYALPLADISKTRAAIKDLVYDARLGDKNKLKGLADFLDRNLAFDLFKRIDDAKIALSTEEEAKIAYAVKPWIDFSENLTRGEFETLIVPRVDAARDLVYAALEAAKLEAAQVDRVVRVGGSSRVPAFAKMLEEIFPGHVEEGEVFTSIASGLLEARERGLQLPR
jgi:hypothetical chaperone protein